MTKHQHNHDDTTPLATVAISAEKMIKAPLGQLVSAVLLLGGALVWCTCVWRDVQDLKRDVAEMKTLLHVMNPSRATLDKTADLTP